jgi:hypothetical protein
VARLNHLARRWRCWWHRPLGHVDEVIEYVDSLSGRWAARTRCARCGRETGLAVGKPKHGAVYPNQPLATMLSRQGVKVSVPPAEKLGFGPPPGRPGGMELDGPDGRGIYVRRIHARFALGRSRDVYLAVVLQAGAAPVVASDLRSALERAVGPGDTRWLDRSAKQLEAELPSAS